MPLPILSLQTRVTASTAKQDKIEFTMPLGTFREVSADLSFDDIIEFLSGPPRSVRSRGNWDVASLHSVYFNRATGERRSGWRELAIRQEPIQGLEYDPRFQSVPLCSGKVVTQIRGVGANRYVTAEYRANVNPTRFVRYQNCNALRPDHVHRGLPPLFRNTCRESEEYSLDGSDNWLPDRSSAIWNEFIRRWPDRLRDYFNELQEAMRGEMARRGEQSSSDGTGTLSFETSDEPWPLEKVETYWEFSQEVSPEFMEAIERAMRSFSALPYVREEFTGAQGRQSRSGRGRDSFNGTFLSVTARPGTKIVVYAKTNQRVRLEIRHDLRNFAPRSTLPREAAGVAGMVQTLQTLSEDAAATLNTFLTHLERQQEPGFVSWSHSPTDLIFRVVSRCHSYIAARSIMRMLMTEGAVTRVNWLNESINALVASRILEHSINQQGRQAVTFVPAPPYHMAMQRLREIGTADMLTLERRQRRPR